MRKGQKIFGSTIVSILLVVIIVIAVNVISAGLYFRWDVTEENIYTLSKGSQQIINNLKFPVTIKYYFSENLESLPLVYKNYGKKIGELLREYEDRNSDLVTLEIYNPKPDSDEEEWAKKYGLSGLDLANGERLFMGIVAIQEDKEANLPIMDPRREQFLEYDITQLILQIQQTKEKKIGVLSSIPVMGVQANQMQQMQGQQSAPKWVLINELEKTFKVEKLSNTIDDIPGDISILLLIHPKNLNEQALYAIDQFVLRGGELIVLVDPNARVDQIANMMAQMGQMPQASSNLERLFKHWGVDYFANKILGDKDHPTMVNAGQSVGAVSFTLWHSLDKRSFNQDLIATKELDDMILIEPGAFTLSTKSTLKLNPLIKSSLRAGFIDSYMIRFGNPLVINKQLKAENKEYYMAGILTGKLTSAFVKRPEKKPEGDAKTPPEKKDTEKPESLLPHLVKTEKSASILLVTDVDFIHDQFSVEKFNLLGQVFSQPRNDNLNFMVNMIEFLGGAEDMMAIRSRGKFSRPFTRFLELEKKAQIQYQEEEAKLSGKLKEVQEKLSRLNVQKGTNKIVLTKEQIENIQQFREQEKMTKSALREIRKLLRQDIETEKMGLTLINLIFVPIILIFIGLFLNFRRFRVKDLF